MERTPVKRKCEESLITSEPKDDIIPIVSNSSVSNVIHEPVATGGAIPKANSFHPPSGRLASVTRKENELQRLMNEGIIDVELLHQELEEYKSRVHAVQLKCFEQILDEHGKDLQKVWWGNLDRKFLETETNFEKYINDVGTRDALRAESISSKGTSVSSSSSARIKLAERKAALAASKAYEEKMMSLENEEVKNKQSKRRLEIMQKEMENRLLEEELNKIDNMDDKCKIQSTNNEHDNYGSEYPFDKREEKVKLGNVSTNNFKAESELLNILKTQNTISMKIAKHQEKSELPRRIIEKFNGDITKFKEFIQNFQSTIENKCDSYSDCLHYLQQFTSGVAKDLVDSCTGLADPREAYYKAWNLLKEEYGNEHATAAAFLKKLKNWKNIKSEDGEALHELAIYLLSCRNNMEEMSDLNTLNSHGEIMNIVMKLPYELRRKWRDKTVLLMDNDAPVTFTTLVKFVKLQARILKQPSFGNISDDQSLQIKKKVFVTKNIEENAVSDVGRTPYVNCCLYCKKANHEINKCFFFKKIEHGEKIDFIKRMKLCFSCLKYGHTSRGCLTAENCDICRINHPTVLHFQSTQYPRKWETETEGNNYENPREDGDVTNLTTKLTHQRVLCSVIPIKIKVSGKNSMITVYASLDTCSSSSFIDERLLHLLGICGIEKQININTMHESEAPITTKVINNLEIYDLSGRQHDLIPVVYAQKKWPFDTEDTPRPTDLESSHLKRVPYQFINSEISLLIGMDRSELLKPRKLVNGPREAVYATLHTLGWALNGPVQRKTGKGINNKILVHDELTNKFIDMFNKDYKDSDMWANRTSINDVKFKDIMDKTVVLNEDNHYSIDLPLKENIQHLPVNKLQALKSFHSLKKRLASNEELFFDYSEFMKMMINRGYMEEVPYYELESKAWFVTHHAVYHKEKKKIRVVFNCSLKYKEVSLNDLLYQGPDMTNNLLGVILRFRQEKVAFMGDVEKMFFQVQVSKKDRDYLRVFWLDNNMLEGKPRQYRLTVHLFGATSSPSVAGYALRRTVTDNPEYDDETKNAVLSNFYVDDLLYSAENNEKAIKILTEVEELVSKGGFNLTQFVSNSCELLNHIENKFSINNCKIKAISDNKDRALGLIWNVEKDTLQFKVKTERRVATKRGILSTIHSIYDPLGLISPALIRGKHIFQVACQLDLSWDDELPNDLKQLWSDWVTSLPELENYHIARCCKPACANRTEMHIFSDGSETAYGSVAYMRFILEDGTIHCSPLLAKVRLTPSSGGVCKTIPRIELNAAKLTVILKQILEKELDYKIDQNYYWCDSMTVLKYVNNADRKYERFIANRINFIESNTNVCDWRYVPSDLNPADSISRGVSVEKFTNLKLWKCGPEYLWKEEDYWPVKFIKGNENIKCNKILTNEYVPTDYLLESCSSWHKLCRRIAIILRLKCLLLRKDFKGGDITINEVNKAEMEIIKYIQKRRYHFEIVKLMNGELVSKNSELRKLNPYLDHENVLRVEGRLQMSTLPMESVHPIILSGKDTPVTYLLEDIHRMFGHMGRNTIAAQVRQKYWIVGLNAAIKRMMYNCTICRRLNANPYHQKMAQLPSDRLMPDVPPFTNTGIDYFGPFEVINGRKCEKRYGVVFSCLASRAIHIEMSYSLTTHSFINTFRRFLARRGCVKLVRSDNGTNLVSGSKELKQEINKWNQSTIHNWMMQKSIDWKFNPPSASHFGGVYEREIRSIRRVLSSILKEQPLKLSDESLCTLLCEVESILNCRPLTQLSQSITDNEPLTANHLLLLHSGVTFPPGLFSKDDMYVTRRWKQVQYLSDLFWSRWKKEYIVLLQERQKWYKNSYQYQVGDLVLLVDQVLPRNQWSVGRVTKLYPSKDNIVRVVQVRVSKTRNKDNKTEFGSTLLNRPVIKLILLATYKPGSNNA